MSKYWAQEPVPPSVAMGAGQPTSPGVEKKKGVSIHGEQNRPGQTLDRPGLGLRVRFSQLPLAQVYSWLFSLT